MKPNFKIFLSKFFYKFENIKIYAILILFSLMVVFFGTLSYFQIKNEILNLGEKFRNSISKEISFSINEWLQTRIKSTQNLSSFLQFFTAYYDENQTFKFIKEANITSDGNPFFDHYQIIFDTGFIIFDNDFKQAIDFQSITQTCWFKKSTCKNKSSISIVEFHDVLKTKTIHICAPFANKSMQGSICGVIISDKFFAKVRPKIHPFVDNAYLFDEDGNIISSIQPMSNSNYLKNAFLSSKKDEENWIFNYDDKYMETTKIPLANWYISVAINEKAITSNTVEILLKNGAFLAILFLLLIVFSNSLHTFIHNKIIKKQKEYEFILSHQLKMSETGELISAISHQLKQPLNSSLLLLSSTLDLKKSNELSDEELLGNLDLCMKSNLLMNETIDNFRNFYKFSNEIKEFDLYSAIIKLTKLLQIEFARYSISLFIDKFDIKIISNESFLQQILLVLLQNSKDALKNKESKKRIKIEVNLSDKFVEIYVKDTGDGVLKPNNLFNKYNKSTKKHGSGIGLYLAKLIAKDKLGGDIELVKDKNPTTFKLKIKQNMEQIL